MKKILITSLLLNSLFSISQNIVPIRVKSFYENKNYELSWVHTLEDGTKTYSYEKFDNGKILHYKDTINNIIYNNYEFETDIFNRSIKNSIFDECVENIVIVEVQSNSENSQYKYSYKTNIGLTYNGNYKHNVGESFFCIDKKNNIHIKD
jgi:hypothetical protein